MGPALPSTRWHLSLRRERASRGLCLALVPAILLLGFLSRGNKHVDQALFRTAENWQQPKCPGTDVMKEILGSFSRGYVVQLLKGRWEGTRCGRENDGEILLGEK